MRVERARHTTKDKVLAPTSTGTPMPAVKGQSAIRTIALDELFDTSSNVPYMDRFGFTEDHINKVTNSYYETTHVVSVRCFLSDCGYAFGQPIFLARAQVRSPVSRPDVIPKIVFHPNSELFQRHMFDGHMLSRMEAMQQNLEKIYERYLLAAYDWPRIFR